MLPAQYDPMVASLWATNLFGALASVFTALTIFVVKEKHFARVISILSVMSDGVGLVLLGLLLVAVNKIETQSNVQHPSKNGLIGLLVFNIAEMAADGYLLKLAIAMQ